MKTKKIRWMDFLLRSLIYLSIAVSVFLVLGIIVYVFYNGMGSLNLQFFTQGPSEIKKTVGILPMIINTLYMIVVSLLIAVPISIGGAIYLNEYANHNSLLVKIILFTIDTLAAIPSIIYGLFGFVFFCGYLHLGTSILSGCFTLAIVVLPTIIRTTQQALREVPAGFREGALGLGATKFQVIKTVLLPSAISGIVTGVILSIGRIVGESAALLFTAGIGYSMPKGIFSHLFKSGATLSVQLYQYAARGENFGVCFAIASVLIVVVILINYLTKYFSKKLSIGSSK